MGPTWEQNIFFGSRRTFLKPIVAKRTSRPSPTTTTSMSSAAGSSKQSDKQGGKRDYTNCLTGILERFQLLSVGGGRFLGQRDEEDEEDLHHRRMTRCVFTPFCRFLSKLLFIFLWICIRALGYYCWRRREEFSSICLHINN